MPSLSIQNNREAWLIRAKEALEKEFFNKPTRALPKKLAMSCGIPKGSSRAIGQCWDPKVAKDGTTHIFICPSLEDPIEILGVLLHELAHACLGIHEGHGKKFKEMVKGFGLKGKVTATFVGKDTDLYKQLTDLLDSIGPYPHKAMNKLGGVRIKKPRAKHSVKLQSVIDESYVVTMKISLLEEHGPPLCPYKKPMIEVVDEDK